MSGDTPRVEVCTISQAAATVGVCRRTIYFWMAKGLVDYVTLASGRKRIVVDTLWRTPEGERHSLSEVTHETA